MEHLLFVWLIQMDALHYLGDGSTSKEYWSAKGTLLAYCLTRWLFRRVDWPGNAGRSFSGYMFY